MKILVVCDQGNNRSVMVAHHLKYWGHDVIAAGIKTNSPETLRILEEWADRIIITEAIQIEALGDNNANSALRVARITQLWNIGPDHFPRPFNPELNAIVKRFTKEHEAEYKPK